MKGVVYLIAFLDQWVYVPTFAHASDDTMQLPNNNLAYLLANYLTLY